MILIRHETGFLQFVKEGDFDISEVNLKVADPVEDMKISFNGGTYLFFEEGMNIPSSVLKATHLNIRLRLGEKVYTSDHIPAVKYTILGERVEELYPHSIAHILKEVYELRSEMQALEKTVQDYEEFIQQIQDTGDII